MTMSVVVFILSSIKLIDWLIDWWCRRHVGVHSAALWVNSIYICPLHLYSSLVVLSASFRSTFNAIWLAWMLYILLWFCLLLPMQQLLFAESRLTTATVSITRWGLWVPGPKSNYDELSNASTVDSAMPRGLDYYQVSAPVTNGISYRLYVCHESKNKSLYYIISLFHRLVNLQ